MNYLCACHHFSRIFLEYFAQTCSPAPNDEVGALLAHRLCVVGQPGSGKSHLVDEMIQAIPPDVPVEILRVSMPEVYQHNFSDSSRGLGKYFFVRNSSKSGEKPVVRVVVWDHMEICLAMSLNRGSRDDAEGSSSFNSVCVDSALEKQCFYYLSTLDPKILFIGLVTVAHGSVAGGVSALVRDCFDAEFPLVQPTQEERRVILPSVWKSVTSLVRAPWIQEATDLIAARGGGLGTGGLVSICRLLAQSWERDLDALKSVSSDQLPAVLRSQVISALEFEQANKKSFGYIDVTTTKWEDIAGLKGREKTLARHLSFAVDTQRTLPKSQADTFHRFAAVRRSWDGKNTLGQSCSH